MLEDRLQIYKRLKLTIYILFFNHTYIKKHQLLAVSNVVSLMKYKNWFIVFRNAKVYRLRSSGTTSLFVTIKSHQEIK